MVLDLNMTIILNDGETYIALIFKWRELFRLHSSGGMSEEIPFAQKLLHR